MRLATWDGTGAVERRLDRDANMQGQHVGQRAADPFGAALYSGILELQLDGPQTAEAMFESSEDGVLLLTDFSRLWAPQWLVQHGRRHMAVSGNTGV